MTKYTKEEEFQLLLHFHESLTSAKEEEIKKSLEVQKELSDKIAELQQQLEEEKRRCDEEVKLIDASLSAHDAQLKREFNYPPEQPKKVVLEDNEFHDDSDK